MLMFQNYVESIKSLKSSVLNYNIVCQTYKNIFLTVLNLHGTEKNNNYIYLKIVIISIIYINKVIKQLFSN